MIWAFHQELRDDDEAEFFDHSESSKSDGDLNERLGKLKVDREGLQTHQERKANGFRLFGKYYQALWD